MSAKRQKNQLQMVLAFTDEGRSEAPKARREGTESLTAKRACESPAIPEQLMEEVEERGGTTAGAKVSGLQLYGRKGTETAHRAQGSAPL